MNIKRNQFAPASWLQEENCMATDYPRLTQRLHQVASKRGLSVQRLGEVAGDPILFLAREELNEGPNLLTAAGFHGDEPAGCWGVVRFLETASDDLIGLSNLAFLPLINPTGFQRGQRENCWGEDPNRGFVHTNSNDVGPSQEGSILVNHLPMLKWRARDGFLSLHEDIEVKEFYLYTFEDGDAPGLFSEALRAEGTKFFQPYPDGLIGTEKVQSGIIFRECDGSFEDLLFHGGVIRTACTETPGLLDINRRVQANASIVERFARFAIGIDT